MEFNSEDEFEKIFSQRVDEVRNPLSGQELADEAIRILMKLRSEEDENNSLKGEDAKDC